MGMAPIGGLIVASSHIENYNSDKSFYTETQRPQIVTTMYDKHQQEYYDDGHGMPNAKIQNSFSKFTINNQIMHSY